MPLDTNSLEYGAIFFDGRYKIKVNDQHAYDLETGLCQYLDEQRVTKPRVRFETTEPCPLARGVCEKAGTEMHMFLYGTTWLVLTGRYAGLLAYGPSNGTRYKMVIE